MQHPKHAALLLLTTLTLAACNQDKTPVSSASPMGVGDDEERLAAREWNEERLRDPNTGKIPDRIREKEIAFAQTLPARNSAKNFVWTHQGPINRGGRTRAFRVDITDPNILIAGSATGGIWRSTDAGITWMKTLAPAYIQNTSCIGQDIRTGHTDTWYVGTGENYGVVSGTDFEALLPGDGIFKSTDGGLSWTQLGSTVSNDPQVFDRKGAFKHVNSVVVDPTRMDSDIVVAAIFDGITRSNDGGQTWTTVLGIDTAITATSLYTEVRVSPSGVYYAAIGRSAPYKGVYRSTDGLTWTNIGINTYPLTAERTVIAIDPSDENRVWFFCESPGAGLHGHSLYRYTYLSGDGTGTGGQWDNRSPNLPNGSCTGFFTFDFGYINTQTSYDMAIAVHPTQPDVVFIGGTSVYRSTNGWTTPQSYDWIGGYRCNADDPKSYVYPNHHPDQHWLEFAPNDPNRLYSTNDGGVHVTTDALADSVSWTVLNHTYITSQFYTCSIEEGAATTPYILGGTQDNGCWLAVSTDASADWKFVHQDDGAYCAIPEGRAWILTSSQAGRLYKKTIDDAGNVLGYERIDPTLGSNSYNFINQFVLDPASNNKVYWVSANKIWRNNDITGIPVTNNFYDRIDTNWEQLTAANITSTNRVSALDISRADPEHLFYGSNKGRLFRLDSLSTDPQKTEITPGGTWPGGSYISCVAPNDYNYGEWLVTLSNYGIQSVWHTLDTGATWTSVSGNLEENVDGTGNGPAAYWGLIYPTWGGAGNRYFVGTSAGLFSTDVLDGDNTVWEMEDPNGIGNVPINMIAARGSDGLVAVGTHGSGIYTTHLPSAPIGIVEPESGLGIGQPWPNPAMDLVNIDLYFTHSAEVSVSIFSLDGRAVLRRSLGHRNSGNGRYTWDLRDGTGARVSSGTYVVAVESGGSRKVVRVVVR